MSVIVWDGKTLATDRAALSGSIHHRIVKAWRHEGAILTGTGSVKRIHEMVEWYKRGVDTPFPEGQKTSNWCHFIVVDEHGLKRYEQSPIPIEHGFNSCAFGSGQDLAYGALAMGASAEQAVEIANQYSRNCGHGVDIFHLKGE